MSRFMNSDWAESATCASGDPEAFFPDPSDTEATAAVVELCRWCPVARECWDRAVEVGPEHGVWAGTTDLDRARLELVTRHGRRQSWAVSWAAWSRRREAAHERALAEAVS